MRKIILMLLLAAVSNNAMAKWDEVSASKDGLQTNYVDRHSIRMNIHIAIMWNLLDFKKLQKLEESSSPMFFKSIAQRFDYDCKNNQYRMTAYDYYSDNLGQGDIVIGDSNLDNSDWQTVKPYSLEEMLWNIACDKK